MSRISRLVRVVGNHGGFHLARALTKDQPRILMYHRFSEHGEAGLPSRKLIRDQFQYVAKYFRPITLSQMVGELFEDGSVSPNTVAITVDDGYQDFYDVAWPVAKELKVPLTLFVTTGFVNGDLWLWPDKVSWILTHRPPNTPLISVGGLELDARLLRDDPTSVWQQLIQHMLMIPDIEKHQLIEELSVTWGVSLPNLPPVEYSACTWDQLLEMQSDGLEVGGHSVTHPSLGQVDESQARGEIFDCMHMLNEKLGNRARSFCYPNGMPNDYSVDIANIVRKAGFSCAVTAFADMRGVSRRYALRRHAGSADWFQFYKSISGIEFLGHRYHRTLLGSM